MALSWIRRVAPLGFYFSPIGEVSISMYPLEFLLAKKDGGEKWRNGCGNPMVFQSYQTNSIFLEAHNSVMGFKLKVGLEDLGKT